MKTEKISVQKICMIAFAICINFVGGQIALFLKLPIYLDSIGTVFVAAVLGPFYGMLPNLLSGLLMGMTVLRSGRDSSWFCDRSRVQKIPAEKVADISGCSCDHTSIYHNQFLYYGVFIWRNHFFRIHRSCTASGKNTSWNGRKLLCGSVYHRLH